MPWIDLEAELAEEFEQDPTVDLSGVYGEHRTFSTHLDPATAAATRRRERRDANVAERRVLPTTRVKCVGCGRMFDKPTRIGGMPQRHCTLACGQAAIRIRLKQAADASPRRSVTSIRNAALFQARFAASGALRRTSI